MKKTLWAPKPGETPFQVNISNEFNELQAQYAVFLSDSEGKVLAFRWLPGSDTAQVQAPGVATDRPPGSYRGESSPVP